MDEETATRPGRSSKRGLGLLWAFVAVVLAFGAGFGWQYLEANRVRAELAETHDELMVERLRVRLAQASIAAQAGDYETARQRMSEFFTHLDNVAALLPEPAASAGEEFLTMRDEVITGLSRANPEYAGVLYRMLDRFRGAVGLQEDVPPRAAPPEPAVETEMAEPDTTG